MLPVTMLNTMVQMAMIAMSAGVPKAMREQERDAGRDEAADVGDEAQEEGQDEHRQRERDARARTMITSWLAAPTSEIAAVPIM